MVEVTEPTVVIVGAGPTGLSAAAELRRLGVHGVVVVERDKEPGGIPRFTDHQGFGIQDLRRSMTGPRYATSLVRQATALGVDVRCAVTATKLADGSVELAGPAGIEVVRPRVTILATGARERPRSARLIPGDRGAGVMTTGQLQQRAMADRPLGRRAVIVGAEHVSYSAAMLLRHQGASVVAMVTEQPGHQSVAGADIVGRMWLKAPLMTATKVVEIIGRRRVEGVVLEEMSTKRRRRVDADTVVLSGDWIPDNELARRSGLEMDPMTRGPLVDASGRTSTSSILAGGNLVHPVETAGTCSLEGRLLARALAAGLADDPRSATGVRLHVRAPVAWAWPGRLDPTAVPPHVLFQLSTTTTARHAVMRQGTRVLGTTRLRHGRPGRSLRIPGTVAASVDPGGEDVTLEVES